MAARDNTAEESQPPRNKYARLCVSNAAKEKQANVHVVPSIAVNKIPGLCSKAIFTKGPSNMPWHNAVTDNSPYLLVKVCGVVGVMASHPKATEAPIREMNALRCTCMSTHTPTAATPSAMANVM